MIGTLKDPKTPMLSRGMEAAVERVLHDWTGGQVSPIEAGLQRFDPAVKGVLDYGAVARYYCSVQPVADVSGGRKGVRAPSLPPPSAHGHPASPNCWSLSIVARPYRKGTSADATTDR